jgi:uncharacterized membrane protein
VTAWQWVWVYLIIACTWLVIAAIMAAVYWSYWAEQREKNYQKDKADESRRKFCNAVMVAALSPVWVIVTLTVLGVWVRAASREVGRAFCGLGRPRSTAPRPAGSGSSASDASTSRA